MAKCEICAQQGTTFVTQRAVNGSCRQACYCDAHAPALGLILQGEQENATHKESSPSRRLIHFTIFLALFVCFAVLALAFLHRDQGGSADVVGADGTVWTPIACVPDAGCGAAEAIENELKVHAIDCGWEGSVIYEVWVPKADAERAVGIIRSAQEKLKRFGWIKIRDDENGEQPGGHGTRWSNIIPPNPDCHPQPEK